jgi:hypothetical protein
MHYGGIHRKRFNLLQHFLNLTTITENSRHDLYAYM